MGKMTKILKQLLAAVVVSSMAISSLAGCSGSGEKKDTNTQNAEASKKTAEDTAKEAQKEKTKIKVWARGSSADPGVNAIIDKFQKAEKNIEIEYQYYGDNYANIVKMAIAAGTPPEVFEASTGLTIPELANQDAIVPVDDLWTDDLKKQFHPDTLKQFDYLYKGKPYTIPVRISAYRLLYNKDVFKKAGLDPEKPPQTLEEMRTVAKKITEAGKGEFYGFGLPLGVGQIWERIIDPINIAMGNGGRYGYDKKTGKFDMELSKKLFNYYLDLKKDGSLFPGYITLGIDPLRANFSQGKIGMYIDGNWMVGNYAVQLKTTANWDVAPLPVFEGSTKGKYWAENGVAYAIGKSKNIDAAKKFYQTWITSQDLANKFMPAPRTYNAANEESALPVSELKLQGVKGSFDTSDLEIPSIEPHKFLTLKGDDRNKVFTNLYAKSSNGDIGKELDSAIQDLNKRYDEALEKAIADGVLTQEDLKRQ